MSQEGVGRRVLDRQVDKLMHTYSVQPDQLQLAFVPCLHKCLGIGGGKG